MNEMTLVRSTVEKLKQFIFIIATSTILLWVSLFDFVKGEFVWQNLNNFNFWIIYWVNILLGIAVFFLSSGNSKSKHKRGTLFAMLMNEIRQIAQVIQAGFDDLFSGEIHKLNRKDKIILYTNSLKRKKDRAKFWGMKRLVKYYDEKLLSVEEDIDHMRIPFFKPVTANVMYSGYSSKSELVTSNMHYTGSENIDIWLIPTLILSAVITAAILGTDFGEAFFSVGSLIKVAIRVIVMLLYIWRGDAYGDYSINTVLMSVLGRRKGFMSKFITEQGYDISPAVKDKDGKLLDMAIDKHKEG
jgi:hypothetical protein